MVPGLQLACIQMSANVGQRLASLLSAYSLSALPLASDLAAKIPSLISFPALGRVLCELPLSTQDKANEQRNWPPAETKGKAKSVC